MLAEQVLALIIFISMFVLIVLDKIERHYWMWGIDADWGIWNYHEVARGGY
mgnify:CR=1 FL=1